MMRMIFCAMKQQHATIHSKMQCLTRTNQVGNLLACQRLRRVYNDCLHKELVLGWIAIVFIRLGVKHDCNGDVVTW